MLQKVFPELEPDSTTVLAFYFDGLTEHASPEEQLCLPPTASDKRVQQFHLGRYAAREALKLSGLKEVPPLLRDSTGLPIWPEGFIGSISHTGTTACASVCAKGSYQSIGVDIERLRFPKHERLPERIFTKENVELIHSDPDKAQDRFTAFFSSCESIFKSISPLTLTPPQFQDVHFVETDIDDTLQVDWITNRTTLPDSMLPRQVQIYRQPTLLITLTLIT
jgi:4'-phosphopantetheinyl transferase EntD